MLNVLLQLVDTPHILEKVQGGQIKKVCRLIELCLLNETREYQIPFGLIERHLSYDLEKFGVSTINQERVRENTFLF